LAAANAGSQADGRARKSNPAFTFDVHRPARIDWRSDDPELQGHAHGAFRKGREFVRAFQGFDRQGWKRLEILDAASPISRVFQATALKP
jgi:hypothetical protein